MVMFTLDNKNVIGFLVSVIFAMVDHGALRMRIQGTDSPSQMRRKEDVPSSDTQKYPPNRTRFSIDLSRDLLRSAQDDNSRPDTPSQGIIIPNASMTGNEIALKGKSDRAKPAPPDVSHNTLFMYNAFYHAQTTLKCMYRRSRTL